MKKAVLLSIKPKWCELIFLQRKTLEVRKSMPSIETPFKVYIYETKAKWVCHVLRKAGMTSIAEALESGFGNVVGEFTCDKVSRLAISYINGTDILCMTKDTERGAEESCLSWDELLTYSDGKPIYGWHISDLRVYADPKPITDFKRWNRTEENAPCAHTYSLYAPCETCKECNLARAPQSFCYVEELP